MRRKQDQYPAMKATKEMNALIAALNSEHRSANKRDIKLSEVEERLSAILDSIKAVRSSNRGRRVFSSNISLQPEELKKVTSKLRIVLTELRKMLSETKKTLERIVTSRIRLSIGTKNELGRIDIPTERKDIIPQLTSRLPTSDRHALILIRLGFEIVDSQLFDIETRLNEQFRKIHTLRANLIKAMNG
jgi:hypothetical protein